MDQEKVQEKDMKKVRLKKKLDRRKERKINLCLQSKHTSYIQIHTHTFIIEKAVEKHFAVMMITMTTGKNK